MAKAKTKKAAAPARKAPERKPSASAAPQPAASTAVLDELLKATKQDGPKKGESLADFSVRCCTAMAEVSDDVFNGLTAEARGWYDDTMKVINVEPLDAAKLPPLATPGMPGYVQTSQEASASAAAAEPTPASALAVAAAAPQAQTEENDVAKAKAKAKKEKGTTERKPNTESMSYKVRLAVVKNPEISFEGVVKKLDLKGKEAKEGGHTYNMFNHAKKVMEIVGAQK